MASASELLFVLGKFEDDRLLASAESAELNPLAAAGPLRLAACPGPLLADLATRLAQLSGGCGMAGLGADCMPFDWLVSTMTSGVESRAVSRAGVATEGWTSASGSSSAAWRSVGLGCAGSIGSAG